MATYMVADATKAKADFIAKMDKQKTIWLEGSLVKTKHKYFDLYKMVHPELGEGDELVEYNSKRDKWSLANGYSSTKIYTSSPQNSLQELRDRKVFIIDHKIKNTTFTYSPNTLGSLNIEVA